MNNETIFSQRTPRAFRPRGANTFLITQVIIATALIPLIIADISIADQQVEYVTDGRKLYRHYCSPCHGTNGDGRGFNAVNLDPRPANHRDADFMSRRSDKGLFEAIRGGGTAVGKSTLMPPWGGVFREEQIRSLVDYLRKLCGCEDMTE